MSDAYYDSGALVKLYVDESLSECVTDYVMRQGRPIAIHGFHELEIENALHLKVFRKELTAAECRGVLRRLGEDASRGLLLRQPVNWPATVREALRVSGAVTERTGCRSLDILHVAVAIQWKCPLFLSMDDRQLKAASLAGLKVLDVRLLQSPGR